MHGATLERLCDCVLACRVVSRGHVPLYAIVATSWLWLCRARRGRGRGRRALDVVAVAVTSLTSWPWRPSRPGRGRVMAVTVWFLYRCVVVATRRRTLVFAMVYVVSVLSWFAI